MRLDVALDRPGRGPPLLGAASGRGAEVGPWVATRAPGALRAALASSSVCPCVGQRIIGSKEG